MLKNPYINAAAALVYIALVVGGITIVERITPEGSSDIVLVPIAMLSLLVLSVAIMAVLFFYQPLALFLDGKRAEALAFFVKTLATFAVVTAVLLVTSVALTS